MEFHPTKKDIKFNSDLSKNFEVDILKFENIDLSRSSIPNIINPTDLHKLHANNNHRMFFLKIFFFLICR